MVWWQHILILRGSSVVGYESSLTEYRLPEEGQPIFLAVHGTWAQKARWTESQSPLMLALGKSWPRAGFLQFGWSGVNGARHRIAAAENLSAYINKLAHKYPRSLVIAVAHSHGGNVVAWASAMSSYRFAAAIYLNTPFIQILRQEKPSTSVFNLTLFPVGLACLFPPIYLMIGAIPFISAWQNSWQPPLMTLLFLGFLRITLPSMIMRIRERLVTLTNSARKIDRELSVLMVGDEATIALGAVYFGQWLSRKFAWILIALCLLTICISIVMPHLLPRDSAENVGASLIIGIFAIPVLTFTVAAGAYGLVQGLISLDATVTVTPAPIGKVDYLTVSWAERDRLRHSLVVDSDLAITGIIGWLRGTALGAEMADLG